MSGSEKQTVRQYVWGLDLSPSLQGAGGVGGLLAAVHGSAVYYPCFDANGNITQYVDSSSGTEVARYDYDAFGREFHSSVTMADDFVFRFSTKYTDNETGLVYYGYRFYNAELGRWINRDPIGEEGGLNLYGFVGNRTINRVDYLGNIEVGGGVNAGFGVHYYVIGGSLSITKVITTRCRVCVTLTLTVRFGPGIGVHAGIGGAVQVADSIQRGPSVTAGAGGWVAEGVGASFQVEGNRNGYSGFVGRGEVGGGGAAGGQVSFNFTGSASVLKWGPFAGDIATLDAIRVMIESRDRLISDLIYEGVFGE